MFVHQRIGVVYGDDCGGNITVRRWAASVRDADLGHVSPNDTQRSERPRAATSGAQETCRISQQTYQRKL